MTTQTSISGISSASDHFESLQGFLGQEASVDIFCRGKTHLEGIIDSLASPPGREEFVEELRITLGKNYSDIEVARYFINDAYERQTVVAGYMDNGHKVFTMTVLNKL